MPSLETRLQALERRQSADALPLLRLSFDGEAPLPWLVPDDATDSQIAELRARGIECGRFSESVSWFV